MSSSGKRKTTMAKLARENRLRERRLDKQAKREARKNSPADEPVSPEEDAPAAPDQDVLPATVTAVDDPGEQADVIPGEAVSAFLDVETQPSDPRAKEPALKRLRGAGDEELELFEGKLRDDALSAGATEQELRDAQRHHPGHGS